MKQFDIICIGESLRDIFYIIDEATVSCSLKKDKCLLCLDYAEKIPVRNVIKIPAAGNSANVAVSASRLGFKSALVSWVGKNFVGEQLKETLRREKVDVSLMCKCANEHTSEATLLSYKGERTQLLFFKPRKYKFPKLQKTKWIYYSAMGNNFLAFNKHLVKYLQQNLNIHLAFQPGTTHIRAGLNQLKTLIKLSDIFILNKEEAQVLLNDKIHLIKNLLGDLYKLGAKITVITDNKNGAYAYDGNTFWHMPIFKGEAIESTGAGDAFASAFTCAISLNKPITEALRWGTANAWSVIREIGPQKGLPTKKELRIILKKFSTQPAKI